jgi:hypothetical protein
MFATLTGTNTQSPQCQAIFARLCDLAIAQGFEPPDTTYPIQRDQTPLEGWNLEQKGPSGGKASFFLSVTAPKTPSLSPIPIKKTIAGPLFAVMVMDSFFVVSREDRRDVSEFPARDGVERSFKDFLTAIKQIANPEKTMKCDRNSNTHPITTGEDSPADDAHLCEMCKRRPGKIEHRISPPMRIVAVRLCDECSQRVIY